MLYNIVSSAKKEKDIGYECMSGTVEVRMFPANSGDCLLVNANGAYILIDGGFSETYRSHMKKALLSLAECGKSLSLLVMTHIDNDHIAGFEALFRDMFEGEMKVTIEDIWYNSYMHVPKETNDHSTKLSEAELQILNDYINSSRFSGKTVNGRNKISSTTGMNVAAYLLSGKLPWNIATSGHAICNEMGAVSLLCGDAILRIISPSMQDLADLAKEWTRELKRKKWTFPIVDDPIFDEAMESFLLNYNVSDLMTHEQISHSDKDTNFETLFDQMATPDTSITNKASIALIIEAYNKKMLFCGDASEERMIEELLKLEKSGYSLFFDVVKVPHHGSLRNANSIYDHVDGKHFFISTNGRKHGHPDLATLVKIVARPTTQTRTLVFNYANEGYLFVDNDEMKKKYNYNVILTGNAEPVELER